MHVHRAPTALIAASALLGGLPAATPADAAPRPACRATVKDADVTMRPFDTAAVEAEWKISCRRSVPLTVSFRVCSPGRYEDPVQSTRATRHAGSTQLTHRVDPENPMTTAVLHILADGRPLGEPVRACATKPDGSPSCYPADGRFGHPEVSLCG